MDTTQPHAYRGITGADRCLYGLSRDHAGISCGKPRGHLVHQPTSPVPDEPLLDRDGHLLVVGDHVEYVGTLRHLDGLGGEVDDTYGGIVRVAWDDRDELGTHSPDELRKRR